MAKGSLMIGPKDIRIATTLPQTSARGWSVRRWIYLMLLFNDVVAVTAGLTIAYFLRFQAHIAFFSHPLESVIGHYRQLSIVLIPTWLLVLVIFRLYDAELLFGGLTEYARVFNAGTTVIM
ncbi:MAG: hypothetical protein ACFFFO_18150, partial [Candidatus Thorarchaeota archaeon]